MQTDLAIIREPLTEARRDQLDRVNAKINSSTVYVPDADKYGVAERWEDAAKHGNEGDCEDFAIAKRNALRAIGWPQASLDIAVCITEDGQKHAVLVARTDQGDFVLDNRQHIVWRWDQLADYGYLFEQITVGGSLLNWRSIPS